MPSDRTAHRDSVRELIRQMAVAFPNWHKAYFVERDLYMTRGMQTMTNELALDKYGKARLGKGMDRVINFSNHMQI